MHQAEVSLPGGTLPLGVEIQQLAFAFSCHPLKDMYFTKFRIINKSGQSWDSAYMSLINDIDIGAGSCGASDDAFGSDSVRGLSFLYNADNNDCNYGTNPPSLGTRLLQSPLKYTGNPSDTARLPYGILVGYKLIGLTSSIGFYNGTTDPCLIDPAEYFAAFNFMKGLDGCGRPIINPLTGNPTKFVYSGNACNRTGWVDNLSRDARVMQSSGPITMLNGDTQIVVYSYAISRDGSNNYENVCGLQKLSDTALKYYYNDFQTCIPIGIEPISSEVPDRFMLFQNYPNPFNPTTKIKFGIPVGTRRGLFVQIKIYDILGREISTLVNEELKPGTYEVDWSAENYPSGVYFYTITSAGYFDSKKMILLK
jgi:hypothetical protein